MDDIFLNALPNDSEMEVPAEDGTPRKPQSTKKIPVKRSCKRKKRPAKATQNTPIDTKQLSERFDKDKAKYLLEHRGDFTLDGYDKDESFDMLQRFLDKSFDGVIAVTYKKKAHNKGRFFALGGNSMSNMSRPLRHTIASEFYDDVDMVNAHPVILQHLCMKAEIDCPELSAYVADRKGVLKQLDVPFAVGKKAILIVINGDSNIFKKLYPYSLRKNKTLKLFAMENLMIRKALIEQNKEWFDTHTEYCRQRGRDDNIEGSFINMMLCEVENQLLQSIIEFYEGERGKEMTDGVMCFDGVMIPKDWQASKLLRECEAHLKEACGIDMKLKIKPMTDGLAIPDEIPVFDEPTLDNAIPFNRTDPYCWLDFLTEFKDTQYYDSLEDLKNKVVPRLKRVFAKVNVSEGLFYKKLNCFDNLFDVSKKLPSTGLDLRYKQEPDDEKYTLFKQVGKPVLETLLQRFPEHLQYNKTVIRPETTEASVDNCLNTWTGYKGDNAETNDANMELINPMLDILRKVWASDDERIYKSLLYFFAHMIQKPHEMMKKAYLIVGEQGIGKDFFIDFFRAHVLGGHLVSNMTGIEGAVGFNGHLECKVLCIINEMASSSREFRSNFDKIKPLISNPTICINRKGFPQYDTNNLSRWVLFSNHRDVLYLDDSDRRYIALQGSSVYRGNQAHFTAVANKCFNDTAGKHMFMYLRNLDLSTLVNPLSVTTTALAEEMKQLSISPTDKFLNEVKQFRQDHADAKDEELALDPNEWMTLDTVKGSDFYAEFVSWCDTNGERKTSNSKFSLIAKQKVSKQRKRTGVVYSLTDLDETN